MRLRNDVVGGGEGPVRKWFFSSKRGRPVESKLSSTKGEEFVSRLERQWGSPPSKWKRSRDNALEIVLGLKCKTIHKEGIGLERIFRKKTSG